MGCAFCVVSEIACNVVKCRAEYYRFPFLSGKDCIEIYCSTPLSFCSFCVMIKRDQCKGMKGNEYCNAGTD